MKIIDQYHEILEFPHNPLYNLEIASRNCYNSYDKMGCTTPQEFCSIQNYPEKCIMTDCEKHSSQKLIKALIKKGHHSILEFGQITVRLVTNRGVLAELTRHRIGVSFAVQSTRYVKYDNIEFIRPVWCSNVILGQHTIEWNDNLIGTRKEGQLNPELPPAENIFFWHQALAERDYNWLITSGWAPERAREALPNSLKTEIIMSGNYRAWRHLFKLRTSKAAHPQFRALLKPLLKELKEQIPIIFDDIGD